MNADTRKSSGDWHLLIIDIDPEAADFAGAALFDLGTSGTVVLSEGPDRLQLGAYFSHDNDAEQLAQMIEAEFIRCGREGSLRAVSISRVPEQDWMQKWKEGFEPLEIGDRLIVAPSWKLPVETSERSVVRIDPGMAFGTGTHETTRLCLAAIEKYWKGGSLLDVGTGTGILAIAASVLAPGSRVIAIDVDPQAVDIARENAALNQVSIEISGQPLTSFAGGDLDAVVANLTAEMIVDLFPALVACLAPSGLLILSGILTELAQEVEKTAASADVVIEERAEAGEWCGIIARR
jgi:ribosomal protein L11 methyltransferase